MTAVDLDEIDDVFDAIDGWIRAEGPVLRRDGADGHAVFVLAERSAVEHLLRPGGGWEKGWGIDRVRLLLGRGLMVLEGAEWTRHRRVVQPRFHRDALRGVMPIIEARAAALAASWGDRVEIVGSSALDGRHEAADLHGADSHLRERGVRGEGAGVHLEGFGELLEEHLGDGVRVCHAADVAGGAAAFQPRRISSGCS